MNDISPRDKAVEAIEAAAVDEGRGPHFGEAVVTILERAGLTIDHARATTGETGSRELAEEVITAAEAADLPPGSIIRFGSSWYPLTMDDGRWRATPADHLGYTLSGDERVEVLARGVSVENGGTPRRAAPSPQLTRQAVIEAVRQEASRDEIALAGVRARLLAMLIADRLGLTEENHDG